MYCLQLLTGKNLVKHYSPKGIEAVFLGRKQYHNCFEDKILDVRENKLDKLAFFFVYSEKIHFQQQ
jgi:hypothetical protein